MNKFPTHYPSSSVVNQKEYASDTSNPSSKRFNDLIGVKVECPYRGALKSFAIKANSTFVWYDFSWYSSLTSANEFDESILKTDWTKKFFSF